MGFDFLRWQENLAQWQSLKGVEEVKVRLHSANIISDFFDALQLPAPGEALLPDLVNKGLSTPLIKLLLKFPALRSPHDSDVDRILTNTLKFEGAPPWIMDEMVISQIQEATRADNLKLGTLLNDADRARMIADARWWNTKPYQDRKVISPEELEMSPQDMTSVLEQAIPALLKLAGK